MIALIFLVSILVFVRCFWIKAKQSIYIRLPSSSHNSLTLVMIVGVTGIVYSTVRPSSTLEGYFILIIMSVLAGAVEIRASEIRKRSSEFMTENELIDTLEAAHYKEVEILKTKINDYEKIFISGHKE